jgi:hypothetical protein
VTTWCLAHPWMTFFVALAIADSFAVICVTAPWWRRKP